MGESGSTISAFQWYQHLRTESSAYLQPTNTELFDLRNNLATWLGESGDIESAILEFERLIDDYQHSEFTTEDGYTAARNNVAY